MAQERAEPGLRSPLKAVRQHCLDCCNGSANEVGLCPARACPLWTRRLGRQLEQGSNPIPLHPVEAPTPASMTTLAAIRRRCLYCSGNSPAEVRSCTHTGCDLWPFRLGHNPNRAGLGNFAHLAGKTPTHGPIQERAKEIRAEIAPTVREPEIAA
jgi:hypothetical protein